MNEIKGTTISFNVDVTRLLSKTIKSKIKLSIFNFILKYILKENFIHIIITYSNKGIIIDINGINVISYYKKKDKISYSLNNTKVFDKELTDKELTDKEINFLYNNK